MDNDIFTPEAGRRILQRDAGRWWWVPLVGAGIWFVVAWLVFRADYTSLVTVGVILGVAFLIAAANEAALAAAMTTGWAAWHVLLSLVFVFGAVWAFARPVDTFFSIASVLALLLLLQGGFTITRGVALRDQSEYWWLDVVGGTLITMLGIWVATSNGVWNLASRAAFVLLWVGFMSVFNGISDISLAFSLRQFADEARRGQRPAEPRTFPSTPAPTQQSTPSSTR